MKRNKPIPIRKEGRIANTLYSNYTAEVLAAGFIEETGLPLSRLRIVRNGKGCEKQAKELDKVVWEYSDEDFVDYLSFYINKKDIYDNLPQGLFHHPSFLDQKRGKAGVLNSIRKGRQEEFNARYFFRPFEVAIDKILVIAQLYERRLEWKHKYTDFVRMFASQWDVLNGMPLDDSLYLLVFLFKCHRITNIELIADILSVFLQCTVTITVSQTVLYSPSDIQWKLGVGRLGINTVIGKEVVNAIPLVSIHFINLPLKQKELLFKGSAAYKQLRDILDLFIPIDAELDINFYAQEKDSHFTLSDNLDDAPILGFTTIFSQNDKEDESIKS